MTKIRAGLLATACLAVALAALPAHTQDSYYDLSPTIQTAVRTAVNTAANSTVQIAVNTSARPLVDSIVNATIRTAVANAFAFGFDTGWATEWSAEWQDQTVNNSTRGWDDHCPDENHMQFGDYEHTFSAVEEHTIPGSIGSIFVHGARNGGVSVRGWDRNEVQVTACKYAGADSEGAAQQKLSQIQVVISGGDISAQVPEGQQVSVHFLIHAPKSLAMKLEAYNGPLSIRETAGDLEAKTVNGPLSLKLVSGTVHASTQNGPLSISDSSGNITVSAQNGPLSVALNDKQWSGQGLEASTRNGPVTVRVPDGYLSGVDVESSGRSPFSCSLRDCENVSSSKPWDSDKKVHLGSGATVVHVSTVNGPVHIGSSMQ